MLKSKIHRATLTDADLNYEGSITIDEDLMEAADIIAFEQVQIYDINNGNRFETYVIKGERGTGTICVNGAAARLVNRGDLIIIASYFNVDEEEAKRHEPRLIYVNEKNEIVSTKRNLVALPNKQN